MYYYSYKNRPLYQDNRSFILPFLIGGLAGGAAVGLTRPRPIYSVNVPGPMMGFNPSYPAGSYSYFNYYPY